MIYIDRGVNILINSITGQAINILNKMANELHVVSTNSNRVGFDIYDSVISSLSVIATIVFSYLLYKLYCKIFKLNEQSIELNKSNNKLIELSNDLIESSNDLIKLNSSDKPFLKLEQIRPNSNNGYRLPEVIIQNYGRGHAVNVKVELLALETKADLQQYNVFLELNGTNFIPYIENEKNQVFYTYDLSDAIYAKHTMEIVKITYQSNSSYNLVSNWMLTHDLA
jgi:hypothetical protein